MKRRYGYGLIGCSLVLWMSTSAFAALEVIYDSGHTQPLAPYLQSIQSLDQRRPKSRTSPMPSTNVIAQLDAGKILALLPIRSPTLSPGTVVMNEITQSAINRLAAGHARPFFLLGSDALSHQWLHTHRDALQQMGAVGMLIQADTEADVQHIAAIAQGLPITLGSATDIASSLGIAHYPVLISTQGLEQ